MSMNTWISTKRALEELGNTGGHGIIVHNADGVRSSPSDAAVQARLDQVGPSYTLGFRTVAEAL
jgi:hypothetical protein